MLHMDPMDLETKPQVDRLRCWRKRQPRPWEKLPV